MLVGFVDGDGGLWSRRGRRRRRRRYHLPSQPLTVRIAASYENFSSTPRV